MLGDPYPYIRLIFYFHFLIKNKKNKNYLDTLSHISYILLKSFIEETYT